MIPETKAAYNTADNRVANMYTNRSIDNAPKTNFE